MATLYTNMASLTLFITALSMTTLHTMIVSTHTLVDPFFVFIIMRYCISALHTYGSNSTFARLYHRMIVRETIVADAYFMIKTQTLDSAGWFICAAACGYLIARIIKITQCAEDPFTILIYWVSLVSLNIAHALILVSF